MLSPSEWLPSFLKGDVVYPPSAEALQALAAAFAQQLPAGSICTLEGNLGAGKTTFVQGFARGLGITGAITSPTYNIFNTYTAKRGGNEANNPTPTANVDNPNFNPNEHSNEDVNGAPSKGLNNEHYTENYTENITFVHMDAYRLGGNEGSVATETAFEGLMLSDFLTPPYYLAVEWPSMLPAGALESLVSHPKSIYRLIFEINAGKHGARLCLQGGV